VDQDAANSEAFEIRGRNIEATAKKMDHDFFEFGGSADRTSVRKIMMERSRDEILARPSNGSPAVIDF
jgi:hypothetical protein